MDSLLYALVIRDALLRWSHFLYALARWSVARRGALCVSSIVRVPAGLCRPVVARGGLCVSLTVSMPAGLSRAVVAGLNCVGRHDRCGFFFFYYRVEARRGTLGEFFVIVKNDQNAEKLHQLKVMTNKVGGGCGALRGAVGRRERL